METRAIGGTDLTASVVGMGTWAMGNDFFGSVDDRESIRAIQAGIDAGITFIDTAPAYGAGHAEEVVGKAIAGRRDEVVIATKVGILRTETSFERNLKPDSVRREIDESLARLGVDTIDLYQIHWPDQDTPLEDTLAELVKARDAGKYRYLGVSNFGSDLMDQARAQAGIVSLQPHYSLLVRDIESDALPYCQANELGVISYGTLAGGLLTGKFTGIPALPEGDLRSRFYRFYREPQWSAAQAIVEELRKVAADLNATPAQIAIRWVLEQTGLTCALVGAKSQDQARQNAVAGEIRLAAEHLARLQATYATVESDLLSARK